jgi:hypothetical protein
MATMVNPPTWPVSRLWRAAASIQFSPGLTTMNGA